MNLKTFGIGSLVVVLTACSSQPRQPVREASAPAAAPAAPAVPLAASADGTGPPVNRTLVSAGYKPTTIKGAVYYCRTIDLTNTAFKKKVCLDETQIAEQEKKIEQFRREMIRSQPNPACMGPTCSDP